MCARCGHIEQLTNSSQDLAQALDHLFGILQVTKEPLDTLVNNVLRKHLDLEQLTNTFDQTETLTLGLFILIGVQLALVSALVLVGCIDRLVVVSFGCRSTCCGFFANPSAFKIFLTLIEEILAEQLATSDRFSI